MVFQDFLLTENGDLLIKNGDFVVGPSDPQHVFDIISSFAGEWKQFPPVGAGVLQDLKSENGQQTINNVKQQLQANGYMVTNIKCEIENGQLVISFPNNGVQRV